MQPRYYLAALALAVLAGNPAQAQTTKGTHVLGLSVGQLSYQKTDYYRQIGAQLAPSAGLFLADNLALGVQVPVSYSHIKYEAYLNGRTKQRALEIALLPWLRYYLPSTSRHRVFGELSVGGVLSSYRYQNVGYGAVSGHDTNLLASAGLGYSYFLTPNVGLEALVKYSRNTGTAEAFGNGVLGLNLGFRVYLPQGGAGAASAQ